MKNFKYLLIAVFVVVGLGVSAQWDSSTSGQTTISDNIGIGFSAPTNLIHAAKNMKGPQIIIQNLGGGGGAGFTMIDDINSANWKFKSIFGGGFKIRDHASSLDVLVMEKGAMANAIYVKAGGNVGIGTTTPSSALSVNGDISGSNISLTGTASATGLLINGKITAKEVEVTLDGWPDYVFGDDYKLKSLPEVEEFISKNKHLPGVPSEQEIKESGVNLGDMNKILMEKVEELTLYVIELQKEVEELKKTN